MNLCGRKQQKNGIHLMCFDIFQKCMECMLYFSLALNINRHGQYPPSKWAFYAALEIGLKEMTNNISESQNKLLQEEFGNHHKDIDVLVAKISNRMIFWAKEWLREMNGIQGRRNKSMCAAITFNVQEFQLFTKH